jgi:hypothetical protein
VLRIFYGAPTTETLAKVTRGEAVLGGCFLIRGQPDWVCRACRHEWVDMTDPARIELEEMERRIFEQPSPTIELVSWSEHDGVRVDHERSWLFARDERLLIQAEMNWDGRCYRLRLEGPAELGAAFDGSFKPRKLPVPKDRARHHLKRGHVTLTEMSSDAWALSGTLTGVLDRSAGQIVKVAARRAS